MLHFWHRTKGYLSLSAPRRWAGADGRLKGIDNPYSIPSQRASSWCTCMPSLRLAVVFHLTRRLQHAKRKPRTDSVCMCALARTRMVCLRVCMLPAASRVTLVTPRGAFCCEHESICARACLCARQHSAMLACIVTANYAAREHLLSICRRSSSRMLAAC